MATIKLRKNKTGELSFLIRVSLGYDNQNKQIIKSMTYKPEKELTERQAKKEAQRRALIFEEECKAYNLSNRRVKFQVLADEWLHLIEQTQEMKPSTVVRLKAMKERTYNAFGNTYVDKITYRQIQCFILDLSKDGVNQRTGKGLSQKTQKHYLTFISDVMKYALKCGYVSSNPCKDISVVKTVSKEKDIYSLDELKLLLTKINERADTDYKVFFNLLAYCGIRRGEALGIEYKDIDFDTGMVSIVRTSNYNAEKGVYTSTPKTDTSYRDLLLQANILDLIKKLRAEQQEKADKLGDLWVENDRLFVTWCGKPMHPNTPYTWLERFCKNEGIPFKGLHSFRHSVATQAITNGVDVKTVSAILGHSQTSTTLNIYAHAVQKSNVNALNLMAGLLENF
ncbi:MAG: site-specific integrase [Clostridia bacterium]|nr:site-specific integrase [Clostridia bacterium]